MLVRRRKDGRRECIHQEHHGLISALLGGLWDRSFGTRLMVAIALHDNPWREADRVPLFDDETEDIVDFVQLPTARRLPFYQSGIDALEDVDPYVAYLTSRHYTAFKGTEQHVDFQAEERERRERLRRRLTRTSLAHEDDDLAWLQFFDVLSLYLCLTGPDVDEGTLPGWLAATDRWSTTPRGRTIGLSWRSRDVLELDPWPLRDPEGSIELNSRVMERPLSAEQLEAQWASTPWTARTVRLVGR